MKKGRKRTTEVTLRYQAISQYIKDRGAVATVELCSKIYKTTDIRTQQRLRQDIQLMRKRGEKIVNVDFKYEYQNSENTLPYEHKLVSNSISRIGVAQKFTMESILAYPELTPELQNEIGKLTIYALSGRKVLTEGKDGN